MFISRPPSCFNSTKSPKEKWYQCARDHKSFISSISFLSSKKGFIKIWWNKNKNAKKKIKKYPNNIQQRHHSITLKLAGQALTHKQLSLSLDVHSHLFTLCGGDKKISLNMILERFIQMSRKGDKQRNAFQHSKHGDIHKECESSQCMKTNR